jgi:hypothetical protein
MGVMMATASALFTAGGYPSIYARKSSDSGSDSGGIGSDDSSKGKNNPEPRPPKDEQNGKTNYR